MALWGWTVIKIKAAHSGNGIRARFIFGARCVLRSNKLTHHTAFGHPGEPTADCNKSLKRRKCDCALSFSLSPNGRQKVAAMDGRGERACFDVCDLMGAAFVTRQRMQQRPTVSRCVVRVAACCRTRLAHFAQRLLLRIAAAHQQTFE